MRCFWIMFLCSMAIGAFAQEVYDDCDQAFNIANPGAYCSAVGAFNNISATEDIVTHSTPTCWTGGENDVWFIFSTATTLLDFTITVNGETLLMPQIALYRGDCTGFAELACASAVVGAATVSLDVTSLDPNEIYYIRVNDYSDTGTSNEGSFQLCIEEFEDAVNMQDGSTTSCTGTLFDSGGDAADYANDEDFTYTICPSTTHQCLFVEIEYDIENGWDFLTIYDAADATDQTTLVDELTGVGTIIVEAASGCMTLNFTSDGIIPASGWTATWNCSALECTPPPPPSNCSTPTIIAGLPYNVSGLTTCGVGNDFSNADACGSFYMNGDDYVFEYTSLGDECVQIDLTNTAGWTGVHLLDGCPTDAGTNCIAQAGETGGNPSLYASIEAAGTYYIIVSTWPTPDCTPFDIHMETVACYELPDPTTCGDTFYDTGGPLGAYSMNEDYSYSICPTDIFVCIELSIDQINLDFDGGDVLTVYNGPDTNSPLIESFTGFVNTPYPVYGDSTCITVSFTSDGVNNGGTGWGISWSCSQEACPITTPINVIPDETAETMANIISTDGTVITNFTIDCPEGAYGSFTGDPDGILPMSAGILLSTGFAVDAAGSNIGGGTTGSFFTDGDTDLEALSGFETNDACAIEFDIYATTDLLRFSYVFASEEYDEYACSEFNDVFGFFISGPGITGPFTNNAMNVALIPDTNLPVTINNVNSGAVGASGDIVNCSGAAGSLAYSDFYQSNPQGPSTVEFDGMTINQVAGGISLVAEATVIPCNTYHLRLVVADGGDWNFDSGVFIEANSLTTALGDLEVAYDPSLNVEYAIEGCADAALLFTIPEERDEPYTINYVVGGNAVNGLDYVSFPDSVTFEVGDTEVLYVVEPIDDAFAEGTEEIWIYLFHPCDPTSYYDSISIEIQDFPIVNFGVGNADLENCLTGTVQLEAFGANQYIWSPAAGLSDSTIANPIATVSPTATIYQVIGINECQQDTSYVTVTPVVPVVDNNDMTVIYDQDINVNTVIEGCANATLSFTIPAALTETYTIYYDFGGTASVGDYTTIPSSAVFEPGTTQVNYMIEASDDATAEGTEMLWIYLYNSCSASVYYDSIAVEIQDQPEFNFGVTNIVVNACNENVVQLEAFGADNYVWSPSTGLSDATIANPTATLTESMTYQVTGSNICHSVTEIVTVNYETMNLPDNGVVCIDNNEYDIISGLPEGDPDIMYSWTSTSSLSCDDCPSPTAMPTETTVYTLTMTTSNCAITDDIQITVEEALDFQILTSDTMIYQGGTISLLTQLGVNNQGVINYEWSPSATLNSGSIAQPNATPLETTTYTVSVTSELGCSAEDEVIIEVGSSNYALPNAFTPNGDGDNDYFNVISAGGTVVKEFKIFDRWGQVVYNNEAMNGWDGFFQGSEQPQAVYVYFVLIQLPNGEEVKLQGDVLLIR